MLAGSGWRLTEELRRDRVGRWLWQPRRAREGRRGRGSRVAPSIAAKASSQGLKSDPAACLTQPNPTPTRLDSHDSGRQPLLKPELASTAPRRFSFFASPCPTGMTTASTVNYSDFHAVESVAALRGATGTSESDNEAACDSP